MKASILCATLLFLLTACTGLPQGIKPVNNFELQKYQGKWYEIARLDHSFERGLNNISANYSINDDGTVKVINRGYDKQQRSWQLAEGKAKFVGDETTGHLKVSFFGPFYGSYVIFKLDKEQYQYAYITSYNKDYLWLLSRTPTLDKAIIADFVHTAQQYGFDVEQLIYVQHNEVQ
ncbi:lipocalin family protein [Pseudoalteromonas byunsanensis]|uniref:Outer membrane lipoprotein Blc n=1 Tax=Pseudoalteromonas byunsanensis TaxID=327939 RepID=A0A1S1MXZ0_9GAMM|nr:lipocalin family protein [Pseudoalteromonas byunsanensis]OHU93647.1 lipocalin [Pseudoalteromonas byunsanensis]